MFKQGNKNVFILFFLTACFFSCRNEYGIIYKIFNSSFKTFTPLTVKGSRLDTSLIGSYLLDNEIALHIERSDSINYQLIFMPSYISDEKITLRAYLSDFKNERYLNVMGPDYHYLIFRLNTSGNAFVLQELSNAIEKKYPEKFVLDLIREGNHLHDSVFFTIPLKKISKNEAMAFCRSQLIKQVRDIQTFYKFAGIFPQDSSLSDLKNQAIKNTLAGFTSVEKVQQVARKYPDLKSAAQIRSRSICYTTKNCVDYLRFYPETKNKDSLIDKAFYFAKDDTDFALLISEFPNHTDLSRIMTMLFYSLNSKKKIKRQPNDVYEKISKEKKFIDLVAALKTFERIPYHEIKFNKLSYAVTKPSAEILNRISYTIEELNRGKKTLHDLYIFVQCQDFPSELPRSEIINFKISVNRAIQLKQFFSANKYNGLKFHFIPVGRGLENKDTSGSSVRITLNIYEAEKYKSKFVKQCFRHFGVVIPTTNGEFVTETYLPDNELENYCFEILKKSLKENPKTQMRLLPCHFVDETCANGNPDFSRVNARFYSLFLDRKLRKREPEEFTIPVE